MQISILKTEWNKIEENRTQIIKDINRTFNKSSTFGEGTEGQTQLKNVLEVIAFKYTGIGYVQGMNFLVAALLYHSSPYVTLGLMSHLLENLQFCDISVRFNNIEIIIQFWNNEKGHSNVHLLYCTLNSHLPGSNLLLIISQFIKFKAINIIFFKFSFISTFITQAIVLKSPIIEEGIWMFILIISKLNNYLNIIKSDWYAENLVGVHYHNKKLWELTAQYLPELSLHLKNYDVNIEVFTTQWIIDLFSHIIPLNEYYLLFDSFFKYEWSFIYRLVLTVLSQISKDIIDLWDWSEILEGIKEAVPKINWKTTIYNANYNFAKIN